MTHLKFRKDFEFNYDVWQPRSALAVGNPEIGTTSPRRRAPRRPDAGISGGAGEARLDIRLPSETKRRIEAAARLDGTNVAELVRAAADARARSVLEASTRITLERSALDRFVDACDGAALPNEALRRSARRASACRAA